MEKRLKDQQKKKRCRSKIKGIGRKAQKRKGKEKNKEGKNRIVKNSHSILRRCSTPYISLGLGICSSSTPSMLLSLHSAFFSLSLIFLFSLFLSSSTFRLYVSSYVLSKLSLLSLLLLLLLLPLLLDVPIFRHRVSY